VRSPGGRRQSGLLGSKRIHDINASSQERGHQGGESAAITRMQADPATGITPRHLQARNGDAKSLADHVGYQVPCLGADSQAHAEFAFAPAHQKRE
jgi:hypothetical protein